MTKFPAESLQAGKMAEPYCPAERQRNGAKNGGRKSGGRLSEVRKSRRTAQISAHFGKLIRPEADM